MKRLGIILINLLFWCFFVVSSTILVIFAVPIRLLTQSFDPNLRILQKYSCFWASLYLWFNPFWSSRKIGHVHADPKKAYVIISNHQSMADILILFNAFLHFKWVAKKSLFNLPLLGWNMRFNGYVPIDRGDERSREKCMQHCRDWLQKGSSVLFFPEGTRSKDGKLLPFKKGAFRLALETGHDILPIVIKGSLHAIPKHSILLHGRSRMTVEILPPVAVQPFLNEDLEAAADKLATAVRAKIEEKL